MREINFYLTIINFSRLSWYEKFVWSMKKIYSTFINDYYEIDRSNFGTNKFGRKFSKRMNNPNTCGTNQIWRDQFSNINRAFCKQNKVAVYTRCVSWSDELLYITRSRLCRSGTLSPYGGNFGQLWVCMYTHTCIN